MRTGQCYNAVMSDETKHRVWHVENLESWQGIVQRALTKNGYLVTTTGTATEAKKMVPALIQDIEVAILDGNLEDGNGEDVAALSRNSKLSIGIIGLSDNLTTWADVSLDKTDFERDQLLATVAKLIAASTHA